MQKHRFGYYGFFTLSYVRSLKCYYQVRGKHAILSLFVNFQILQPHGLLFKDGRVSNQAL